MRLVAAGAAFRGAGRDVRHHGYRDRGRRGIDDAGADGPRLAAARQERLWALQEPGHREEVSEHRVQPVHRRGNDGGEVRTSPRTSSTSTPTTAISARLRRRKPAASRTKSFRCRSPAPTARPTPTTSTKASASTPASTASGRQADRGERQAHRGQRQPDLRRRLRRDGASTKGPEIARRRSRWRGSIT